MDGFTLKKKIGDRFLGCQVPSKQDEHLGGRGFFQARSSTPLRLVYSKTVVQADRSSASKRQARHLVDIVHERSSKFASPYISHRETLLAQSRGSRGILTLSQVARSAALRYRIFRSMYPRPEPSIIQTKMTVHRAELQHRKHREIRSSAFQ